MTQLHYEYIERGPLADEANQKYFFQLQDPDALPVLLLPDFLPSAEFTNLRNSAIVAAAIQADKGAMDAPVTTSGVGQPLQHTVVDDIRRTRILQVHPTCLDRRKADIEQAIRAYWFVQSPIDIVHGWQCLLYELGGHYRWHCDAFNFREGKWNLYYPKRSFSLIYMASNWTHGYPQQHEFSGGELVFTHIVDQFYNRLAVYPKANTLIVFPSNFHYMHQVNPVREGCRVSFVNWWGDRSA